MNEGRKNVYPRPSQEDRATSKSLAVIARDSRIRKSRRGIATRRKTREIRGDSRLLVSDTVVRQLIGSAPSTIQLFSAIGNKGRRYRIEDSSGNAGTNAITLNPLGSETISGATSASLSVNWGSITIRSDGTNWVEE